MSFAPGSPSLDLDFIEQKSERSVMPQDTGVGRNVVLDGLDFASLRRVWEQTFGATPPSSLSRVFLHRVLAYERQCRTHGGHSATTRRILAAMANETPSSGAPAGSVSAGTHLVREWNGRTYQLHVRYGNGVLFGGRARGPSPDLRAAFQRLLCQASTPTRTRPPLGTRLRLSDVLVQLQGSPPYLGGIPGTDCDSTVTSHTTG